MVQVQRSTEFDDWLHVLKDAQAKARILVRIARLGLGNPGDVKPVGKGLLEMRIDYGPGYRVYFMQRGPEIAILLCGGSKSTQSRDIAKARAIAELWNSK